MRIEWRESLATGVEEIDSQHKELLVHFDRMLEGCKAGRGAEELKKVVKFLKEYVVTHFTSEESLQQRHNYPLYESHKREHDSFVDRVKALEAEINAEGIATHNIIETNNLLLKWLLNHISVVDKQLGSYLQDHRG